MLALGSERSIHVLAPVFIKGGWAGWKEQWLRSQVNLNLNPVWVTYSSVTLSVPPSFSKLWFPRVKGERSVCHKVLGIRQRIGALDSQQGLRKQSLQ